MFKIVIVISIVALILLASVTLILVKMNWSEKLYSPILSLLLAGTVTTFITVLLLLKGETFESTFSTLIVINSENHLPPFLGHSFSNEFNNKLSGYSALAAPKIKLNGEIVTRFDSPRDDKEETVFYEELLQYRIFKEIIDMHYEKQGLSQGVTGVSSSNYQPFKLTEPDKKPLTDFASELSKNRFANNDTDKVNWDLTFWKLPKGTNLEFKRIPSSEQTGVERLVIVLTKSYYFTIEITIAAGFTTALNSIPSNLEISPEAAQVCKTSMFVITTKSNFEKITAGNWRTEELKNWAKWLSDELGRRLADQPSVKTVSKTGKNVGGVILTHSTITKIPA